MWHKRTSLNWHVNVVIFPHFHMVFYEVYPYTTSDVILGAKTTLPPIFPSFACSTSAYKRENLWGGSILAKARPDHLEALHAVNWVRLMSHLSLRNRTAGYSPCKGRWELLCLFSSTAIFKLWPGNWIWWLVFPSAGDNHNSFYVSPQSATSGFSSLVRLCRLQWHLGAEATTVQCFLTELLGISLGISIDTEFLGHLFTLSAGILFSL